MHKVTIEDGKDDLANQVAENPVEEIVKSAPVQIPAPAQPQQQPQTVQTSQSVEITEEQRIFGTDEDAKKLFADPSKRKMLTGDPA